MTEVARPWPVPAMSMETVLMTSSSGHGEQIPMAIECRRKLCGVRQRDGFDANFDSPEATGDGSTGFVINGIAEQDKVCPWPVPATSTATALTI